MHTIYIASNETYAGKSTVIAGLGLQFKSEGNKIGYFKPLGTLPVKIGHYTYDQDTYLMKKIFDISDSMDFLCPITLTSGLILEFMHKEVKILKDKLESSWEKVYPEKDIIFVDGLTNLQEGLFLGIDYKQMMKLTKAKMLLVVRYNSDLFIDYVLFAKEMLKEDLLGLVINIVPVNKLNYIKENFVPFLQKKEISTLGVIPKDNILASVTVRELVEALAGEVVCCDDKLDELVENFSIGAMAPETALGYFRRIHNKAVITGGDRSDIQVVALETPTKCLILTGNIYPNAVVIAEAEKKSVPIIVVSYDTLTTVEIIDSMAKKLPLQGEKKITHLCELFRKHFDFALLKQLLK